MSACQQRWARGRRVWRQQGVRSALRPVSRERRLVRRAPQILIGASSSSSTGWFMKTSRAPVQSPRISASVRLTCLPGRLPRTSKSLAMTSSTSVGPEAAVDEDAIHPRSERRPPAARAEAAQLRLAAQGQQGISEAPEGCSDLLHGSWRPPRPKLTQHGAGATRAITRALRERLQTRWENRRRLHGSSFIPPFAYLAVVRWMCLPFAAPERGRRDAAHNREGPHDARGRPPSYPLRLWGARPSPPCFQA